MEILNTIEILAFEFAENEYEAPKGSRLEFPEEWDQFWNKCLSDKNLESLKPIESGHCLVDIETIKDNELKIILEHQLDKNEQQDIGEITGRFYGGTVIRGDNCNLIEPTCCGDIGNLRGWKDLIENSDNTWKQLWIGHPWVFYRRINEEIEFSDYTESNRNEIEKIKPNFKIQFQDLKIRVEELIIKQNEFENKAKNILKDLTGSN